jgi:hypothetical protein
MGRLPSCHWLHPHLPYHDRFLGTVVPFFEKAQFIARIAGYAPIDTPNFNGAYLSRISLVGQALGEPFPSVTA